MVVYPPKLQLIIMSITFLFLFSHLFNLSHSSDIPYPPTNLQPYDRNILIRIQNHFGGPKSGFWNSSDPECCVYCYDQPVRCDEDGHVTGLVLTSDLNLSGSIPSSVANLMFLQELSLNGAGFTGRIPPSIGRMKNLRSLLIVNTSITGQIPGSLGRLKNLTSLYLNHNKLVDLVPDSLGRLSSVSVLDLSSNMLSEPIPDSLGYMPSLSTLILNTNRFSGPIPDLFCRLTNLNVLVLSQNRFSGSIPDCFGSLKNRIDLWLSQNQLTGSVPKSVGQAGFWTLDVSSNKLTDVSNLFGINRKDGASNVDISNNDLEFDLSDIVFWDEINRLNISHNKIYGSLPKQLAQMSYLVSVDVSYNQLCGSIPQSPILNKLNPIYFEHNKCLCGAPLRPCK